jgi:hypothetical protein
VGGPNAATEVQIEGLDPEGGLGLYGDCMNQGAFPDCDDDDSGSLRYVSIRYGGFNLSDNNEINGLTLGAIGRGTDIDYVEVFQNKDDGIEFFGGTVNVKHAVVYAAGDDGLDYDEGYRGLLQFALVVQGTPGNDKSDKGAEQDGGNGPSGSDGSRPFAIPTWYNVTMVGLGQKNYTGRALNTALHFRDNAGGRQYNSAYLDFGGKPALIEGGSLGNPTSPNTSGERAITAYPPGIDAGFHTGPQSGLQLELEDTCFWCFGEGGTLPTGDSTAFGGDSGKEHFDNGMFTNGALDNDYQDCNQPLPIRELTREVIVVPTVPDPIASLDPRPADGSGLLVTDRLPPADGFFRQARYKGAFSSTDNWAKGWTNLDGLGLLAKCDPIEHPDVIPNPARDVTFTTKTRLVWQLPLGEDYKSFDVLQVVGTSSADAADFTVATCEETNDVDLEAEITADPDPNEVFFLVVRVTNNCGENLGSRSDGTARIGPFCP